MSDPSFAQLFHRSRYSKSGPSADKEQDQERKEIFAVAAVGFALRYDARFKQKFLKRFVGIEEDVEKYKLSIQDTHCADLALKNDDRHILVVFEFKVEANLEKHQNPWFGGHKPNDNVSFWSETKDGKNGYGYELGKKYGRFTTIYYTVVQQNQEQRDEPACEKLGKTFWLKSRSWNSLLDPNPGMEEDLVKSLGELGITELEDWRMKEIRIKSEDIEALFKGTDAMELLWHIATKLKLRNARNDLINYCTKASRGSLRQLCITLPKEKMKTLTGIRANFQTAEYGYYSENHQPFRAGVWFYKNKSAKLELPRLIKEELENSAVIEDNPYDESGFGLGVLRIGETSMKDYEWFCKVLGIK